MSGSARLRGLVTGSLDMGMQRVYQFESQKGAMAGLSGSPRIWNSCAQDFRPSLSRWRGSGRLACLLPYRQSSCMDDEDIKNPSSVPSVNLSYERILTHRLPQNNFDI